MLNFIVNYILGIAIALDQLLNAIIAGDPDIMVSARAYEESKKGSEFWKIGNKLIDKLFFWQINHCEDAFEYEKRIVLKRAEEYKTSDK